jgi:PAS domain S-box-containing protein
MDSYETLAGDAPGAEKALFRALIASLPDCIYVKDRQSRFLILNEAFAQLLGANKPEEAIGKTDADFFSEDLAARYRADDEVLMETGQTLTKEEPAEHNQSGEHRWLLTTKMPLRDEADKIIGVIGISRDITQAKRTEEELRRTHDELEQRIADRISELTQKNDELAAANEALEEQIAERIRAQDELRTSETRLRREQLLLRTLIDNLPDPIYAKDSAGRKILANPADVRNMRCKDEAEAVGKTDFEMFPAEIAAKFWADDQVVLQTGEPVLQREEYILEAGGVKQWLLTSKVPMRDEGGKIVGLVGIGKNITSLKETGEKLEALHKELLAASRQAGMAEVATGVLHNVGNVLNSVNVSAALVSQRLKHSKIDGVSKLAVLVQEHRADLGVFLTQDERGRQVPAYLDQLAEHLSQERTEICSELAELTHNIEHIKEIVAMQQNYARILGVAETVVMPELVEDAVKINAGAYQRHGVGLVRDYHPLPAIVVDKHKVLQILVNLLSNAKYACDASSQEKKQVTVRIEPNGANRIRIQIADNGVGIAAENITRIFSQGFTTRRGGHGFGLHSGALAATELGGSLSAQSEGVGHGATFTLDLPLTPPASPSPTSSSGTQAPAQPPAA